MRMRKIGRGSAAALQIATMDDSEDLLKVSALKWLADTGKLEQLQKQCAGYTSEAGKVKLCWNVPLAKLHKTLIL